MAGSKRINCLGLVVALVTLLSSPSGATNDPRVLGPFPPDDTSKEIAAKVQWPLQGCVNGGESFDSYYVKRYGYFDCDDCYQSYRIYNILMVVGGEIGYIDMDVYYTPGEYNVPQLRKIWTAES